MIPVRGGVRFPENSTGTPVNEAFKVGLYGVIKQVPCPFDVHFTKFLHRCRVIVKRSWVKHVRNRFIEKRGKTFRFKEIRGNQLEVRMIHVESDIFENPVVLGGVNRFGQVGAYH